MRRGRSGGSVPSSMVEHPMRAEPKDKTDEEAEKSKDSIEENV